MKFSSEKGQLMFWSGLLLVILSYMIVQHVIKQYKFNSHKFEKRFSRATITGIKPGARSPDVFEYKFKNNGTIYESEHPIVSNLALKSNEELKLFIGKKFFVYYVLDNPKYSKLLLNKPVKDTILVPPPNGWMKIPE